MALIDELYSHASTEDHAAARFAEFVADRVYEYENETVLIAYSSQSEALAFLLADDRGLLLLPELGQASGYALYQDPGRNRQRRVQFDQAWDTSITDADLRSFLL